MRETLQGQGVSFCNMEIWRRAVRCGDGNAGRGEVSQLGDPCPVFFDRLTKPAAVTELARTETAYAELLS